MKIYKFKQFLYILCLSFILICGMDLNPHTVYGNEDETETESLKQDWFTYKVDDNGVTIIGSRIDLPYNYFKKNYPDVLTIPNKVNGVKVVAAEPHMFVENPYECPVGSKTIKCSDYMTTVNMDSFSDLFNYGAEKTIILGKYTRHFNQFNVTGSYEESFFFNEIKVPKKAAYLKAAKNGAVYTKDGKVLVAYPSNHRRKSLKVSSSTVEIEDYAFCEAKIETITLPKSVKKVSVHAFENFMPSYYDDFYNGGSSRKAVVKVPKSKLKYYKKVFGNTKGFKGELVTY